MQRKNEKSSNNSTDPDKDAGETFLGRWSRRKQHARREPEEAAPVEPSAALSPAPDTVPVADAPPERVLTDEDMPPLDSLNADSDYSGFLSPGVSEELRKVALRKLFLSPIFNIVDGLDDYADDFTKFEPLGDIITADMRHQMELAEERAKKALEEELAASNEEADATAIGDENTGERGGEETLTASADKQTSPADKDEGDDTAVGDAPNDETRPG